MEIEYVLQCMLQTPVLTPFFVCNML